MQNFSSIATAAQDTNKMPSRHKFILALNMSDLNRFIEGITREAISYRQIFFTILILVYYFLFISLAGCNDNKNKNKFFKLIE